MPTPSLTLCSPCPTSIRRRLRYPLHAQPRRRPGKFASRRHQTQRAAATLHLAASLDIDFAVHLGDLVQEYPDTPDFPALDEALSQLQASGLQPLPAITTSATRPIPLCRPIRSLPWASQTTSASIIVAFRRRFIRAIVLNSQIMNTSLGSEQRVWLADELSQHDGRRLFVFLHLPPYRGIRPSHTRATTTISVSPIAAGCWSCSYSIASGSSLPDTHASPFAIAWGRCAIPSRLRPPSPGRASGISSPARGA